MSNFICPTCGFNNIDCGRDGYKTDREIELEKKLKIATEVITQARDTAYDSCQTCPKCELIDKMLTELLEKIKE